MSLVWLLATLRRTQTRLITVVSNRTTSTHIFTCLGTTHMQLSLLDMFLRVGVRVGSCRCRMVTDLNLKACCVDVWR